jgi:rRNA maturation protein Nop10
MDFKANIFHCPHCGVYTKQEWYNVAKGATSEKGFDYYEGFIPDMYLSVCSRCNRYTLWINDKIIHPTLSTAPWPTEDMPLNVKDDFLEARSIANSSPKSASAILRLCLQKLMFYLGESGKNMDADVSNLIRKGLPERFRDAFRAVRVIGFEAVAPGEVCALDDPETANALFNLVNMVVESTISQQRKVNQLYTSLPNTKPLKRRHARKGRKKAKKSEIIPKPTILYR